MAGTDGQARDVAAAPVGARPGSVPVVIALAAAAVFGAADQYLPVAVPMSSHPGAYLFAAQISQMSAPWLLLPFLAGAWQRSMRNAVLIGLATTLLAVVAYVFMIVSPMEGTHLTARVAAASLASQWPWFAGGLITGPLQGWLGHRWRAARSPSAGLVAVLPLLLEPAARWLATHLGLAGIGWFPFSWPLQGGGVAAQFAELTAGLLLTGAAITVMARHTLIAHRRAGA